MSEKKEENGMNNDKDNNKGNINTDTNRDNKENNDGELAFYEKAGSARAVTSGVYVLIFSLVGSILMWGYYIIATGTGGLEYYNLAFTISTIMNIFAAGFSSAFATKVKEAMVLSREKALERIGVFSKIFLILGVLMTAVSILMALFISDHYISFCIWAVVPQILINHYLTILLNILNVRNRYDITGAITGQFGVFVFVFGFLFIEKGVPGEYHAFFPLIVSVGYLLLMLIFFKRVTKYTQKEILFSGKLFSKETGEFLKYSSLTTVTNLDALGVLGNVIFLITAFILTVKYPESEKLALMQIFSVVAGYVVTKLVIVFFAGPFNVEIAEAYAKGDHKLINSVINNTGRIVVMMGLLVMAMLAGASRSLLTILHRSAFTDSNGVLNVSLLNIGIILFILCAIGQVFYGFGTFFGSALVGADRAKDSAIGFGIALILNVILSILLVYFLDLIGAGLTMLITGIFLVPFMLRRIKRHFGVKFEFRILRQIPHLIIIFSILYFIPFGSMYGVIPDIIILGGIGALTLIIFLPFFGVVSPKD
ncbi:MAG: hypothetical protein ACTSVC_12850, partial [Promethearchaeota archaeon]